MFTFEDLDDKTRHFMLESIDDALSSGNIYSSTRFNDQGKKQWVPLLKEAAEKHDEHWLAFQLEANHLMTDFEGSATPSGGYTIKHVPHTASLTLAEGQFNRFYMIGLARRARTEGLSELEVYRAKSVRDPRPSSNSIIGKMIPVDDVEEQLMEVNKSFVSPLAQPNSGISLRIKQ